MSKTRLTRRSFLIASGSVLVSTLIAACQKATPAPTKAVAAATKAPEPTATPQPKATATKLGAAAVAVTATPAPTVAISKYNEAPMLANLVEAGKLPPVDERLPAEPRVIQPLGEVGKYGGSLRGLVPGPQDESPDTDWPRGNAMALRSPDLTSIVPNIVKGWDLSDDYKELVVHMRKGLKWSDGSPMTTDDVKFWYEDVFLNEDLTPQIDKKWTAGGEPLEIVIDDNYTFRVKFAVPYPVIVDYLLGFGPWAPKHYMAQFHIKHNEKANEVAKKEGYEFWYESYGYHSETAQFQQDADYPTLSTWIFESEDTQGNRKYVRNPYYWVVDTEGNQLPYCDYLERYVAENREVLDARTMAGEGTHASWFLVLPNYSLYKQNEEKGGYTAGLYPDTRASEYGLAFNYSHKDLVLRELFQKKEWRIAMSQAINREEIKELVFAGLGVARQPIADPGCSFFEEGIDQYYIEYDVDKANALLDGLGLKWDSEHEVRQRPDGKPLNLTLEFWGGKANMPEVSEMFKKYWADVGVTLTLKPEDNQFYMQRLQANECDMGVWAIGGGSEVYSRENEPIRWRPPWHWPGTPLGGPGWRQWLDSDGKEGLEPPDIIKHLWDLTEEWRVEPFGTDHYRELGKEIFQINAENCWLIGTVGLVPRVATIKNTVRNAPPPGSTLSVEYNMWRYYLPEQWWLAQ